MDPLSKYLKNICIANQGLPQFVIDIAKVASDLSTTCIVVGDKHITRILSTVLTRPYIATVNKEKTHITVEIIRK